MIRYTPLSFRFTAMAKPSQHMPPDDDWRAYAENVYQPRSVDSLKSIMQCCKRSAREKTLRTQVATEYEETVEDEFEDLTFSDLSLMTRLFRYTVAILFLLPLAIITAMSLGSQLAQASAHPEIIISIPVWFGLVGALLWLILGFGKMWFSKLVYVYVLGHELTHALAVICSFGAIMGFRVKAEGGYIKTNKNNIFIALSPYFIPFWGVVWGIIWGIVHIYWPTYVCEIALYGGIGFWWCFHLFWTAWIIPRDQPDLAGNGTLFSLILVYFANLLVFLGILRIFGAVSIIQFLKDCVVHAVSLWDAFTAYCQFIAGLFE